MVTYDNILQILPTLFWSVNNKGYLVPYKLHLVSHHGLKSSRPCPIKIVCDYSTMSLFSLSLSLHDYTSVRSVRLRLGSVRFLHEERRLPLSTGLPEAPWHSLQQLWGICGGRSGHGLGEDLPPGLLCVHNLQVIVDTCTHADVFSVQFNLLLRDRVNHVRHLHKTFFLSSLFLRQPFPAGDCVTFSGKDCLCQRCIKPMSPTPNGIKQSNSRWLL